MKKVLTIAGSDSSGGAGIQADIKTMTAHGVYGMSVITALTAQNTMGISGVLNIPGEFVKEQLIAVFEDIFPDAVKIGMLPNKEVMEAVEEMLTKYVAKNIVLDPVLGSTSGTSLSAVESREFLKERLFPLCTLITPNVPEAETLCEMKILNREDAREAAGFLAGKYSCNVLIKGGHLDYEQNGKSADLLYMRDESFCWFEEERIDNTNTHGTGCTLSSAIASNLAIGHELKEAVILAKKYITSCIGAGLDIGKGRGPLNHMAEKSLRGEE